MGRPGQFEKGDPRINRGGRPRKPDNTEEKGKLAWDEACAMLENEDLKPELRFQIIKFIAEFAYGKPAQQLDVQADIEADAKVSMIEGMSLAKRKKALDAALKIYEQDANKKNKR